MKRLRYSFLRINLRINLRRIISEPFLSKAKPRSLPELWFPFASFQHKAYVKKVTKGLLKVLATLPYTEPKPFFNWRIGSSSAAPLLLTLLLLTLLLLTLALRSSRSGTQPQLPPSTSNIQFRDLHLAVHTALHTVLEPFLTLTPNKRHHCLPSLLPYDDLCINASTYTSHNITGGGLQVNASKQAT